MPQKLNSAGKMQNYVPAGHPAGGEYGDNATGSNKHFTNFKKPETYNKMEHYEENVSKIKKVEEEFKSIKSNIKFVDAIKLEARRKGIKDLIIPVDEWRNLSQEERNNIGNDYNTWYTRSAEIVDFGGEENINKLVDNIKKRVEISINLPSYNNEEDYLQLTPSSLSGAARLVDELGLQNYFTEHMFFSDNESRREYAGWQFRQEFPELYEKIEKAVGEALNPIRIKDGQDYIEKNFKKIDGKHSIEDDLMAVNPNYSSDDRTYKINCQRCSFAYELRRRGYDVTANPNNDRYGRKEEWHNQMIYKEKYLIKATNYKSAKKQITEIAKKAGDGARFALGVDWKGYSGHCFICENVKGEIKFLDAQTNTTDDVGEKYFPLISSKKGIDVLRMDNADFTGSVKKTAGKD